MNQSSSTLVMMCGLPASGKTTTAARLFEKLGGVLVRSCDIYRDLGIVVSEWVDRTKGFKNDVEEYDRLRNTAYERMALRVDHLLASGCQYVLVDFAHPESNKRQVLYDLCAMHQAEVVVLLCRCDDFEEVRRRFSARRGREAQPEYEASDLSVFQDILRRWQSPTSDVLPDGRKPALLLYDSLVHKVTLLHPSTQGVADPIVLALDET